MSWLTRKWEDFQTNLDALLDADSHKTQKLEFIIRKFSAFDKKMFWNIQLEDSNQLEPFLINYKQHLLNSNHGTLDNEHDFLLVRSASDLKLNTAEPVAVKNIVVFLDDMMASPSIERFKCFQYLQASRQKHRILNVFTPSFMHDLENRVMIERSPIYRLDEDILKDSLAEAISQFKKHHSIQFTGNTPFSDIETDLQTEMETVVNELLGAGTERTDIFISDAYFSTSDVMQQVVPPEPEYQESPVDLSQPQYQQFSLLNAHNSSVSVTSDSPTPEQLAEVNDSLVDEDIEYIEYV